MRSVDGLGERAMHWLLLGGNRIAVTVLIVIVVVFVSYVLAQVGFIAIGPESAAATAFASGLVSGTVTLVTVALSINQFILSRVFGSPDRRIYRSSSPSGSAQIVTPLAVFITYALRSAMIAHYTVSVGPFVPPEERSNDG